MMGGALAMGGPQALRVLTLLEAHLRAHLRSLGDELRVDPMVGWVALRSRRRGTFAEVRPRRRHLEVYLLPPAARLRPLGLSIQAVPRTRGWGWFCSRVVLTTSSGPRGLKALLASYNFSRPLPRRRTNAK